MQIGTKKLEEEQQTHPDAIRFAALVNGKQQGILLAFKDPAKGFNRWLIEGDKSGKEFPNSNEAIVACAEKTGRKIDKDKLRVKKYK